MNSLGLLNIFLHKHLKWNTYLKEEISKSHVKLSIFSSPWQNSSRQVSFKDSPNYLIKTVVHTVTLRVGMNPTMKRTKAAAGGYKTQCFYLTLSYF